MLKYIVYYSFSQSEISSSELKELLQKAREWNEANEITGLLIYRYNKSLKEATSFKSLRGQKNQSHLPGIEFLLTQDIIT